MHLHSSPSPHSQLPPTLPPNPVNPPPGKQPPPRHCTDLPTSLAASAGSAARLGWCSMGMMRACCGVMGPLSRARYTSSPTLDTKSTSTCRHTSTHTHTHTYTPWYRPVLVLICCDTLSFSYVWIPTGNLPLDTLALSLLNPLCCARFSCLMLTCMFIVHTCSHTHVLLFAQLRLQHPTAQDAAQHAVVKRFMCQH